MTPEVLRESNPPNASERLAEAWDAADLCWVVVVAFYFRPYAAERARYWHERHIEEGGQP